MRPRKRDKENNSHHAIEDAQQSLSAINQRTPEVASVVRDMLALRRRNHFAEGIQAIIKGGSSLNNGRN